MTYNAFKQSYRIFYLQIKPSSHRYTLLYSLTLPEFITRQIFIEVIIYKILKQLRSSVRDLGFLAVPQKMGHSHVAVFSREKVAFTASRWFFCKSPVPNCGPLILRLQPRIPHYVSSQVEFMKRYRVL